MHTGTLRKLFLALTFWLALRSSQLQAGDQTVSGNLSVTGTVDVSGNTLSAGTNTAGYPGWATLYTDGTTSTLEFDATRSANIWKWQQSGSTTLQLQMSLNLNNNNELVLYNQASTPAAKITLNPLGTSTFANSLTVNGTDSEMPNQTLVNANSVLTEGLADSRYLSSSASSLQLVNDSATGWASTAMGAETYASGNFSTAMGQDTTASGNYSTAMGQFTTASGVYSTASGYHTYAGGTASMASGKYSITEGNYSTASGYHTHTVGTASTASGQYSWAGGNYSTASGSHTYASGTASTAMGAYTTTSGDYSTASGMFTNAQAYDSFVVGAHNTGLNANGGTASATTWVPTDPLFEIGNGASPAITVSGYYSSWPIYWNTQVGDAYYSESGYYGCYGFYVTVTTIDPSDAFVVYKNGNATVQGSLGAGSISSTGTISAASLSTTGTVTAPTFVTTAPAGDIPMYTGN